MARILMTGTSGAFGTLAARIALKAGHHLAAAMREPDGRNAPAATALRALGASVVEIDVTDDDSVARGTEAALRRWVESTCSPILQASGHKG